MTHFGTHNDGLEVGSYFVSDSNHGCWTVFEVDYEDWMECKKRIVNKPIADHSTKECAEDHKKALEDKTPYICGCDDE